MANQDDESNGLSPKRMKRRAFLSGMAVGAATAGVAATGVHVASNKAKALMTPKALPEGEAAQVALSFQDSRPATASKPKPKEGAPNIVVILLDDCGFADLGCYGSEIKTPAIDTLAKTGLQYTNFRTCSMCSPTRASFLTGLNHHSAGMGWLADIDAGYPGYRGDLTHEAATLAELLQGLRLVDIPERQMAFEQCTHHRCQWSLRQLAHPARIRSCLLVSGALHRLLQAL
jgi:hypothetical protein